MYRTFDKDISQIKTNKKPMLGKYRNIQNDEDELSKFIVGSIIGWVSFALFSVGFVKYDFKGIITSSNERNFAIMFLGFIGIIGLGSYIVINNRNKHYSELCEIYHYNIDNLKKLGIVGRKKESRYCYTKKSLSSFTGRKGSS